MLVDVVEFRLRRLPHFASAVIDVIVNATQLAALVGELEQPFAEAEGSRTLAGSYVGLVLDALGGRPTEHFLGGEGSHLGCGPAEKTVLLGCDGCGEPGCWPLMARIEAADAVVTWSDLEQPHRRGEWSYDDLQFEFDRGRYEAALAALERSHASGGST